MKISSSGTGTVPLTKWVNFLKNAFFPNQKFSKFLSLIKFWYYQPPFVSFSHYILIQFAIFHKEVWICRTEKLKLTSFLFHYISLQGKLKFTFLLYEAIWYDTLLVFSFMRVGLLISNLVLINFKLMKCSGDFFCKLSFFHNVT